MHKSRTKTSGPPPPLPPRGFGGPPQNIPGVRLRNKSIKDFRKSDDSDPELNESREDPNLQQSNPARIVAAAPPPPPRPPPPPPPPPFMGGMPAPTVNLDHLPTPKIFSTPTKTLRIHWAPVNPTSIDKNSFWAKTVNIREGAIINSIDKCCRHFEKQADAKVAGKGGRAAKAGAEKIIGKDGMAMEGAAERHIVKSGMSPEEIRQGVLNFNWKNQQLMPILRNLRATLSDPTKVAMLNAAQDNYGNMLVLDKVGILLAGIPHVETYIQWMLRMEDFDVDCERLLEHSDAPAIAMDKLMTHPGWLLTLKLILVVGNSMNADVTPNGVYGFDLKSINKMANTKSIIGYTFLEYIVETVEEEFPNHNQFWADFDCLNTGMRVSEKRNAIVEETENLRRLVELLSSLLDVEMAEGDVLNSLEQIDLMVHTKSKKFFDNHGFVIKILPIARRLSDAIKEVKKKLREGDEAFLRAKAFFSIDPKGEGGTDYTVDMFMADMKRFMNSLQDAYGKVQKRRAEREKNARRRSVVGRKRQADMRPALDELRKRVDGSPRHKEHRDIGYRWSKSQHRDDDQLRDSGRRRSGERPRRSPPRDDPGMTMFESMRKRFS